MKTEINIAKDYTDKPGGRYISEGPFSGEDFRNRLLLPKFKEALNNNEKLVVILDGGYGYAPSFLEEAFGGLIRETKNATAKQIIQVISEEEPILIEDINKYLSDAIGKLS